MLPSTWDVFPDTKHEYSNAFYETLQRINVNHFVGRELARESLLHVLYTQDDSVRSASLGALLTGLNKVASEETVVGLIQAVGEFEGRDLMTNKYALRVEPGKKIVGLAGSGKKGMKTINISTPAMIIASSLGTYCVKAGSRSTSSLTGSTDLLEQLGFHVPTNIEQQIAIFHQTKFGFFPIEHAIQAFDKVYGGRFFAPHALSYALPAVVLPVEADVLFYGYAGPLVKLAASSLLRLGYGNVFVVNNTTDSIHYIDEMATVGTTSVVGAINGVMGTQKSFNAAEFMGITDQTSPDILETATVTEQAAIIVDILNNKLPGSIAEHTICLNAGTLAYIAGDASHPQVGFTQAIESIRNGQAARHLHHIVMASQYVK